MKGCYQMGRALHTSEKIDTDRKKLGELKRYSQAYCSKRREHFSELNL